MGKEIAQCLSNREKQKIGDYKREKNLRKKKKKMRLKGKPKKNEEIWKVCV